MAAEESKTRNGRQIVPPVDIYETSDVILVADVPGVTKEGLQLDIDKGELTIRGSFDSQDNGGEKLVNECIYGEYYRKFALADTIDTEKIFAKLENGVLTVTLPKRERAKPKKITIETE